MTGTGNYCSKQTITEKLLRTFCSNYSEGVQIVYGVEIQYGELIIDNSQFVVWNDIKLKKVYFASSYN